MKTSDQRLDNVRKVLTQKKIATLSEIKKVAGTQSTMTIHRCLSQLGYITSYSHRGRFYTLKTTPNFDTSGLWTCRSVMFSNYGNLFETAARLVEQSDEGFTARELEMILQVEVKHPLLQLQRRREIVREKYDGCFVYLSSDSQQRRQQKLNRKSCQALYEIGAGFDELLPDELSAAIILFFGLLDEKQRRLYAGLEAAKLGHGGDQKIAELLDLNCHTVAKGRRELFSGTVQRDSVRQAGGGRKHVEKKRLK